MDVVFSVCIVRSRAVGVRVCECFVMQMLYVYVLDGNVPLLLTRSWRETWFTLTKHRALDVTNTAHSVLTGDVNTHSTLWQSYTNDHRGRLIADVISNSDHIILNKYTHTI